MLKCFCIIGQLAIVAILFASSVGCSTLALNVPNAVTESPEIQSGVGKFEFGAGFDDATRYVYTSDASARPPNLSNPEIQSDLPYLFGRAGYTLFEWLEVGVRLLPGSRENFFVGGIGATARVQLIGTGPGPGLKFALYGGALQTSATASGDQSGTFGAGGYNWRAKASAYVLTGGTSIGVRFANPDILVFIAGAYADQSVSGSINHDPSSNGTSPAAAYPLDSIKGSTRTIALGLRFGKEVQFGFDLKEIYRSWPGLSSPETRGGGESKQSAYAVSMYFPM